MPTTLTQPIKFKVLLIHRFLVSNERFKVFLNSMNPRFAIPSESYFRQNLMPHVYANVKNEVKRLIDEGKFYYNEHLRKG